MDAALASFLGPLSLNPHAMGGFVPCGCYKSRPHSFPFFTND